MEGSKNYRFKIYANGQLIRETESMNLEEARKFYRAAFNPDGVAVRLLVNDKPIIYGDTLDALELDKQERFNLSMRWTGKPGVSIFSTRRR